MRAVARLLLANMREWDGGGGGGGGGGNAVEVEEEVEMEVEVEVDVGCLGLQPLKLLKGCQLPAYH